MTDNSLHAVDSKSSKIAIIGGGLTGLFTATLLERSFTQQQKDMGRKDSTSTPHITIFEKSRSVGRLANRYRTNDQIARNAASNKTHWQWAFGAQFFTAKTSDFQQFIAPWLNIGSIRPWCAQVVDLTSINNELQAPKMVKKEQWDTTQARYISTPKMTSWGRALADDLTHTTIAFKTRVAPLVQYNESLAEEVKTGDKGNKKTELFDDMGNSLGQFDWVICTAPNGQAQALMAGSGFEQQAKITEPKMLACYTLMLGWEDFDQLPEIANTQSELSWDVAYLKTSILDRIFIEHQKPAHDDLLPSITIHACNRWSEQHVDEDIETVKAQLLQAAKQALNWNDDNMPSQIDCHRWRYAATAVDTDKSPVGVLSDESHQWIVSGDWCGQGNIESCYQLAKQTVEIIRRAN